MTVWEKDCARSCLAIAMFWANASAERMGSIRIATPNINGMRKRLEAERVAERHRPAQPACGTQVYGSSATTKLLPTTQVVSICAGLCVKCF